MVKRLRDDAGAIEGFVIIVLLSLTGFAVVLALVASVFINHERARIAADFAALAASQAQDCTVASEAARRNGATLLSCALDAVDARVRIALPSRLGGLLAAAGAPAQYEASAHAQL